MRKDLLRSVAWVGLLLVLVSGSVCFGNGMQATEFSSNGDLIASWYWLRDPGLQHRAEWTFQEIPAGTEDVVLEITCLATDRAGGRRGVSATFRLSYGFPGAGMMGGAFLMQEVILPNVSASNDPLGYTCRGSVTIPRYTPAGLPTPGLATGNLFIFVERISPSGPHVAFNKESIVIVTPGVGHEIEEQNDVSSGQDATEFNSTGDLIDTWSWLRDDALQQSAEWTFEGIASTTPILTVEITLLASSIVTELTEVHFLLIVRFPGAATFWAQEVSLPVVDPAAGAAEFRCRGIVQIPRSSQYGTDQPDLIFQVQRISSDATRIALREDSLVIQSVGEGLVTGTELRTASADSFQSSGDLIRGSYCCQREGQFLEWTWKPIGKAQQLTEAAVNLNLLVTNTFNGGSGFSASVSVIVFDLSGKVVESGLVELANTFRPRFSGDSAGIGYAASGSYELRYPEIISRGFKLRLAWPAIAPQRARTEPTGTTRHVGGNENSALLGYVVGRHAEGETGKPVQATVSDILASPQTYEGTTVRLEARFFGWAGGLIDYGPPLSRSDWIVGDGEEYIYVTGEFPTGLSPGEAEDYGQWLVLMGTVRIKMQSPDLLCPYLEVQSAEALEETGTQVLNENDNGRAITMDVGNTLIVRLWGNPTTGYLWECTQTLIEGVLQLLNVEFQSAAAPSGMVGMSGVFIFRFQILASGTIPLQLVYHRPWEEEAIETFSVTITAQAQKR